MKMTILSPGHLSTIQDEGRFGFMSTGAMDAYSMKLANILVGNAPGVGAIEMTMMGISAQFDCDCVIALTGADMAPQINGAPMEMYRATEVHDGDVLTMKTAGSGMRA